jgi:tetratricopeptide (TPR) repeat protein
LKGDSAEAPEAFNTALDIIESTDDHGQLTTTLFNAATTAIGTGQLDAAKDLCNQSIQIQKQLGNKHGQALVYQKLGQIARFERRYSDPVDAFEMSYTLLQDADSAWHAVDVAYKAVIAAQEAGDTEAAEKFCQRGLDAVDQSGRENLDRTVMALAGTKSSFEDSWEATVDLYWRSLCCFGGGELSLALQMLYAVWERADQQQTDELDEVFGGAGILLAAFTRLGWIEGISADEFISETTQYIDSVSEPITSLHHALTGPENNVTSVESPAENAVDFSTASTRELEQHACSQLLPPLLEQQSEIESTTE